MHLALLWVTAPAVFKGRWEMQANTNESQLLPPHVFSLLPSLPLLYNCQYRTHGLQFKYKRIRARPNSNTMFNFEQIAERKIVRAIERGEFENLKGRGLPIHLDDDVHVPKELRIGFRILKNAGISPGEVQVLNEIINSSRKSNLLRTRIINNFWFIRFQFSMRVKIFSTVLKLYKFNSEVIL